MKVFNAALRMVALGVLMGLAGSIAAQQVYPNKPIRLIVRYPLFLFSSSRVRTALAGLPKTAQHQEPSQSQGSVLL